MNKTKYIHQNSIIIDAHQDVVTNIKILTGKSIERKGSLFDGKNQIGFPAINQVDLPRLKMGGITAACWASCPEILKSGKIAEADDSKTIVFEQINFYHDLIAELPGFTLIRDFNNILNVKKAGEIGVILSIEGVPFLKQDINMLNELYQLGVRLIGLTWNYDNALAEGAANISSRKGLTALGKEAILTMNELGITLDVAHLNEASFWDVLKITKKPVICSHTNLKHFYNHFRLLSDEQIKALAKNGGVIGLSFYAKFLSPDCKASLNDVVNQIDYTAEMVGAEYVGIGSDFDGMIALPLTKDLEDVTDYPKLTDKLVKRGYSEEDIKKILGENFLRIFQETWN